MAELKKEIDKLDKILGKYKRRIIQLEMFIKKNGLQVPKEEEVIEEIIEKKAKKKHRGPVFVSLKRMQVF